MADSPDSGTITCQALTRQATEYIENRLSSGAKTAIEQHLLSCGHCKTYLEQLRLVRDSLRQLPDAQAEKKRNELTERFARTMRQNDS